MRNPVKEICRWARSFISSMRILGSTTTPAPRIETERALRMPDGMRWNLNTPWSVCTVCPALAPPLARMFISASVARRSVSFPLPSSPHCPPMTIVTGIANAVLSSISTRFGQRRKDRLAFDLLSQNVHLTLQADDLLPQMQNSRRAGKIDAEIVHQTPDALNSLNVGIRIEPLPPSARGFEESPFFVAPERSGLHAQASCDN